MFDLFELISSPMTFIRETFGMMEESPYIIVNHILQCYFFSLGVSNFIALLLKVISFEYAEQVAESRITMLIGVFLLFYCKIWALESLAMELTCYFSLVMVSLYVYDCCGNISHWLNGWQTVRREFALIGAFTVMAGSTLLLLYSVFKSNEVHYPFTGIYLLLLVLISIGHLFRNRTILYALVGALTMNYLVAARCIKWDSALLSSPHLPLTLIPFFMMALDAEKKERKEVDNPLYAAIFRSCLCLGIFSVLYIGSQPLELILGCVFLFGLLINR